MVGSHCLQGAADAAGALGFVTTEKDEQNLGDAAGLKLATYAAVIEFVMSSESEFAATLERLLAAGRGAAT